MASLKKIENGTASDVISWNVSTARTMVFVDTSTSNDRLFTTIYPLPILRTPLPDKNKITDPITLLNKAYEALPPNDRDEMGFWDCTNKDGLEDE